MSDPGLSLLLVHTAATLFMTGLVWFVQVVHYPLYARVGGGEFARYELEHTQRTGWVVGPVMIVEALTAALLFVVRPEGVSIEQVGFGAVLLTLVWLSTWTLQVPRHADLSRGFDGRAHALLVRSNWLRTGAWSVRAVLVLGMVGSAFVAR